MKTDKEIISEFRKEHSCSSATLVCSNCERLEEFLLNALKEQRGELMGELRAIMQSQEDGEISVRIQKKLSKLFLKKIIR